MRWGLDTNVISELKRAKPNAHVLAWIAEQPSGNIWTTRVCLAEILAGISLQQDRAKRAKLETWFFENVGPMFEGKILDVDENSLLIWLNFIRQHKAQRQKSPPVDILIAAMCLARGIAIVTRDVAPFVACGVPTLNPWTGKRYNGA